MRNYLEILNELVIDGETRAGRNGTVRTLFCRSLRYDLRREFPIMTTKFIPFRQVAAELFWFLSGSTNVQPLRDQRVTIWDEWARPDGEVGPLYGAQMRGWSEWDDSYGGNVRARVDQVQNVIDSIKAEPFGRRHLWTTWNPADIPEMALPPCHGIAVQFFVSTSGRLSCAMYQRSADWFLGVPWNISSYALLTHLMARECGLSVGELILHFGDVHLYENHVNAALDQLARKPIPCHPQLQIHAPDHAGIFDLDTRDVFLIGYEHHPAIKAEVSK